MAFTPGTGGGNVGGSTGGAGMPVGAIVGSAIPAATSAAGGKMDQFVFKPQEERKMGRQAAQLDPFVEMLMEMGQDVASGGQYGGLRGAATNELSNASAAMNAQLSQRGIHDSGYAMQQHQGLTSDVLSNLAQQINQDQLQRAQVGMGAAQGAASIIGGTEGYRHFDRNSGQVGMTREEEARQAMSMPRK